MMCDAGFLLLFVGLTVAFLGKSCKAFGIVRLALKTASCQPLLLLSKKGGAGKNENDPSNWDAQTSPLVAATSLLEGVLSEKQIKTILQENSILTLDDLGEKILELTPFLSTDRKAAFADFVGTLLAACGRARRSIEETLGGESVYDDRLILPESLELYTERAVSVSITNLKIVTLEQKTRKILFNLVLGSSGSGKSVFALKSLPVSVFGGSEKSFFNVHFDAEEALGISEGDAITFPEAVAEVVRDRIGDQLAEEGWTGVKDVNLHLHVIIDEAGDEELAGFINTTSSLRQIVSCIKKKIRPIKFQGGVHITLVGTGLDKITAKIKSVDEANKFRMQPWDFDRFKAFVDASKHPSRDLVLQIVRDFPVLQDLVTNARCAFHLVDMMKKTFFLQKNRLKKFVNVLVSAVADCYAGSNSLRALKQPTEKWAVARSVFKELDKATSQPGVPFFPEFEDL